MPSKDDISMHGLNDADVSSAPPAVVVLAGEPTTTDPSPEFKKLWNHARIVSAIWPL